MIHIRLRSRGRGRYCAQVLNRFCEISDRPRVMPVGIPTLTSMKRTSGAYFACSATDEVGGTPAERGKPGSALVRTEERAGRRWDPGSGHTPGEF